MGKIKHKQRSLLVSIGTGAKDALPKPAQMSSFAEFVNTYLMSPVVCHLTREDYHGLTDEQRKEAKNTSYFCASTFGGNGRRRVANVTNCRLVVLDVDDAPAARALLEAPLEELLPYNFALWTTLTSTPAAPRVRLVVEAAPLSADEYRAAVALLAKRLGVDTFDPVSADPSHLWYRPTVFSDESASTPMVASRVTGDAFDPSELATPDEEAPSEPDEALPVAAATDVTLADVESMLAVLDPDDPPYWGWLRPLLALRHQFEGSEEEAFAIFDQWSATGAKYAGSKATREKWDSFAKAKQTADPVTIRTLIASARAKGWTATGNASLEVLEKMIAGAKDLTELTGPCLKAVHAAALLSPLEVDVLLARIQSRSRALKAPLKLSSLSEAMRALDPAKTGSSVVPTELQGYVFVRELNLWVHPARQTRVAPTAFDLGFSTTLPEDIGRPSTYALRQLELPAVDREVYEPRRPVEVIFDNEHGATVLNTYRQSFPEADPDHAAEAEEILRDHLALLFPDPRHQSLLISWMGWCLRNPGEKARWHVFIQGVQGCGKSLLAEALAVVFGTTNSRKVSPTMILEKFNSWAQNCCFAYFEEILIGDRQRDTMEVIKDLVTGTTTNIRAMRTDAVERPNHLNGMFLSNHMHGLRIEHADRRFYCLCCRQQTQTEAKAIPREHFVQLARLKTDLAGGLRYFLLTCPLDNEFDPLGHAPHTPDRDLVIKAGAGEIYSAIVSLIETGDEALVAKDVISTTVLYNAIRSDCRGLTNKQMCRALSDMGYRKVGQRLLKDDERHMLWFHPEFIAEKRTPTEAANILLAAKEIL